MCVCECVCVRHSLLLAEGYTQAGTPVREIVQCDGLACLIPSCTPNRDTISANDTVILSNSSCVGVCDCIRDCVCECTLSDHPPCEHATPLGVTGPIDAHHLRAICRLDSDIGEGKGAAHRVPARQGNQSNRLL